MAEEMGEFLTQLSRPPPFSTLAARRRQRLRTYPLPPPAVPTAMEVIMSDMEELTRMMSLEVYLRTTEWRGKTRIQREAELPNLILHVEEWCRERVAERFSASPLPPSFMSQVTREAINRYLQAWVVQATLIHPMLTFNENQK